MPVKKLSEKLDDLRDEIPEGATPYEAASIIAESEEQLKTIPKKQFGIQDQEALAFMMSGLLIAATRILSRKMLGTPEGQMQDDQVQQVTTAAARIILRHAPKGSAPGDVTDVASIVFAMGAWGLQLYDLGDRLRGERAVLARQTGQSPQPIFNPPPVANPATNGTAAVPVWTSADIRKVDA